MVQRTVRVDHVLGSALPLAFGQQLDDNDVARDGAVHALEPDDEDRPVTAVAGDGRFLVVELTRIEVALEQLAALDASLEDRRGEVLLDRTTSALVAQNPTLAETHLWVKSSSFLFVKGGRAGRGEEVEQHDRELVREALDILAHGLGRDAFGDGLLLVLGIIREK